MRSGSVGGVVSVEAAAALDLSKAPEHQRGTWLDQAHANSSFLCIAGAMLCAGCLVASWLATWLAAFAVGGVLLYWLASDRGVQDQPERDRWLDPSQQVFFAHVPQIASQTLMLLGLGLSPFLRLDVACIGLLAYLVLCIYELLASFVLRDIGERTVPAPIRLTIPIIGAVLAGGALHLHDAASPVAGLSVLDVSAVLLIVVACCKGLAEFWRDRVRLAQIDPSPAGSRVAVMRLAPVRSKEPPAAAASTVPIGVRAA